MHHYLTKVINGLQVQSRQKGTSQDCNVVVWLSIKVRGAGSILGQTDSSLRTRKETSKSHLPSEMQCDLLKTLEGKVILEPVAQTG